MAHWGHDQLQIKVPLDRYLNQIWSTLQIAHLKLSLCLMLHALPYLKQDDLHGQLGVQTASF